MSKEKDLLVRAKVLLECLDTEPLQDQADLIAKEIQELLAQPEPAPVAWIDDGCNGLIKQPLSFFRSTRAEQVAFEEGIIFAKTLYGIGGE